MCELVQARLGWSKLKMWACATEHSDLVRTMKRTGRWYDHDLLMVVKGLGVEGVFVDVGAHIGSHTVAFHDGCAASKVVAIEPHELHVEYLRKNAIGRRVRVVPTAVSAAGHTIRLDVPPGLASQGFVLVEPDTIDEVLANVGERDVALIRIGVASHCSVDALQSAVRTIQRCLPVIAAKACDQDEHAQVLSWLQARGYVELGRYEPTPMFLYIAEGP